jgi:CRISPR-associated protein Cas1
MARPRCDLFDASAILTAIDRGETTERTAYIAYAATAGRPYARSTFSQMLRRAAREDAPAVSTAPANVSDGDALERWRDRSPVKPKILSLSAGGGLRVKAGALVVFDGPTIITYSKAAKPPVAIVLSTVGGFVSMEAVRFCARARIAIVALDRAHAFMTVIGGAPKASAAMLRAQVETDPLPIARAIVAAKLAASHQVGALADADRYMSALASADSLDRIRLTEAQAARVAWPDTPALRWHAGSIPADWRAPWLMRTRLDAKGKRAARSPINAMLNAAFAVTAGRLAAYIVASGLSPAIGFLHADKSVRWSLAWDAIEPLRPMIEARLFRFAARERFVSGDFIRASDGSLRLAPGLLSAVLNMCAPPSDTLAQTVRWLAGLVNGRGHAPSKAEAYETQSRGLLPCPMIGGRRVEPGDRFSLAPDHDRASDRLETGGASVERDRLALK